METVEERLNRIENRNKVNFFEIERRIAKIESAKPDTEINDINVRMHELEDLILLLQVELSKIKDRLTTGSGELPDLSDIERKINSLEKKLYQAPDILASDTNISEKIDNLEHEIKLLKESPNNLIDLTEPRSAVSAAKPELEKTNERIDKLEQDFESIKSFEELLMRLEDKMSELASSRPEAGNVEMESRISSRLENKIKDIENMLSESSQPNDIERRLEYVENEVKDIGNLRNMIDHENISRTSMEKKMTELNNAPAAPALSSNSIENIKSELENQRAIIEDINKNLELKSVKFLTRNLEEFAKTIDKKIEGMEAPMLDARLRILEQKITKLTAAIRNLVSSMPVIVE